LSNLKEVSAQPKLRSYILLFFLVTLSFANLEATFALLTERIMNYGAKENGYLFTFVGLVVAVVQGGLIGMLVKKFGESRLATIGLSVLTLGFLTLPHSRHLPELLFFIMIIAFGNGVANPSINSLISRNASEDVQGGVLGISQSLASLARVLGPAWGGWVFGKWGYASPYWSGATILVGCVALSMLASMKRQRVDAS
jgi:DHA1 family tetracycline resistance protein-like MFS transporter